jgi:exopolyphosphatase/pppGpp-phosphohydrolase
MDFLYRVWTRTGLGVRVISGDQEAALLKSVYLGRNPPDRAFAFDLGSGSLQWVHLASPGSCERGSLPIGVVRLLRSASDDQGNFLPDYARYLAGKHFSGIRVVRPEEVVGTGGTVRAICRVLGAGSFSREAIEELIERCRHGGAPEGLKPHRLPLFLPGLVLVQSLLAELGAGGVRYENLSVGEALLEKVLPFYCLPTPPHPSKVWKQIRLSESLPR